jgi:pimeloyl-CoA synthetase
MATMMTIITRMGIWTTTEMMAALLERVMDDLYARGIRAVYSDFEECDFLFSRDASTTARVVATAVRFYSEFGAVKAFTRGSLCLSDNFDTVPGRVCAVENFAF